MSWLGSLLDKSREVARLTTERDYLITQLDEARTDLKANQARLYAEIDANRLREDVLKDQIIELAGIRPQAPRRADLLADTQIEVFERKEEPDVFDADIEALIEQRVDEFADEALRVRGIEYGVADREILREKIRANQAEYL